MQREQGQKKIPENLGNGLCGIWPYVLVLVFNGAVHIFLFFFYGQTFQSFFRLFFSCIFFIYPLYYVADVLWSLRPSVCDVLSGRLEINRKYYMNVAQKEVEEENLLPVTVSVPVYMEDNQVIFKTLRESLLAAKRYEKYSGKRTNIIVSDDGLAPMLGGICTKERVLKLICDFSDNASLLTEQEKKAVCRILFYREKGISFVVRPQEGRVGLFKKSSNLNYTLRLGNELSEGKKLEDLIGEGGFFEGAYAEGDIITNEIILLLDKDSGVKERIMEAILPEFATDEKLAYVQCATNAGNLYENYYTYATGHQVNDLFHTIWPCKALQGFFVPLVGHNVFLRKSILEKSGLWSENKVSEDYDKAICFYSMGYHGKYAQIKGLEFTEYASRTFTEETGKQYRYAYGLFEMIFDGTVIPGKTRNCDLFYMLLYFCSVINLTMLLPTVLLECYFGNVHLLWAGFLLCNICFILLPLLRGCIMRYRLSEENSEKFIYILLIALSFIGHSFSFFMGTCRYLFNKLKKNQRPFPSTSVDLLEYRFIDGVKLFVDYIRKNPCFLVISFFCMDRGIFMLTRKGMEPLTGFIYCYILFCAVFSPVLLTPQLLMSFLGKNTIEGKMEMKRLKYDQKQKSTAWDMNRQLSSPRIVNTSLKSELSESDIEKFLGAYQENLQASIPREGMPEELLSDYVFESCLRKDSDGKKEIYLLRRKDKTRALLKITKNYPEEDALEEAKLLAKLNHSGIPKVYAFYEKEDKKYIVREYIEGYSLYEIVNSGKSFSVKDIFGIMLKLTDILSYLHSENPPIIHRDIKPQNIIVGRDGSIHLIDFGIARVHKEERTQDTSVVLTLDYASPEQYGFEQTTPLSDIYSLGVVMLFLATGRTARSGLEAQIVNNRIRNLIERCIAFNPKARIQSVEEIREYILRDKDTGKSKGKRTALVVTSGFTVIFCLSFLFYGMGFLKGKNHAQKSAYEYAYGIGYTEGYDNMPVFQKGERQNNPEGGNIFGNMAIDGGAFAVQGENLVFFIMQGDIYKMSVNGTQGEAVVKGSNARALGCHQDWLYYSSGRKILQTNIHTLRTDILFEDLFGEMYITDDSYYVHTEKGLYLWNEDRGKVIEMDELPSCKSLNIEGEKLFFVDQKTNELFCRDISGKNVKKVIDGNCKSVCLFEGKAFCSIYGEHGGALVKIGENGKKEVLAEENARMLNIVEDGIYFIDDFDGSINLRSFDGRIRKQISKNRAMDFNIAGGWIFYHNEADGGRLWCVRLDGSNNHPVFFEE